MGESIRGLTVEISADASQFNKQLSAMKKESKNLQTELNALTKSLEMNYDPQKFARAQKVAQQALDATRKQADALRERLKFLEESGNADTSQYNKIQAELAQTELKAEQLEGQIEKLNDVDLSKLENKVKKVGEGMQDVGKNLMPVSLAAGAVLAGGAAIGIKAAKTGAEIDDLSNRFDISAEKIQEWQYIAMQTGVDIEVFNKALIKTRASMLDLATGTENNATRALSSLGLSMEQFSTQEEMFDGVLNALSGMSDKTLQAAYANEIFGDKIANQMLPYLNAGSAEIARFKEEFASMSSLSAEQAAALAAFDDVMNKINTQMSYASAQIGVALLPVMNIVADFISNRLVPILETLAGWFSRMSPIMQTVVVAILAIITVAAPLLIMFGKAAVGISVLIKLFKKLTAAQLKAAAGFTALVAAGLLAIDIISNWKNMSTIEKVLKSLALAALVAAAAITVFHASWSLGIAIGAIAAGVVAGLAAINAAKSDIMPEEDDFTADNIEGAASTYDADAIAAELEEINQGYGVYDEIDTSDVNGDIYNYDNSTTTTTQNVTVVIENYAAEVDVDDLVRQINVKLAEEM